MPHAQNEAAQRQRAGDVPPPETGSKDSDRKARREAISFSELIRRALRRELNSARIAKPRQ